MHPNQKTQRYDFIQSIFHAAQPGDTLSAFVKKAHPKLPLFMADADKISAGPRPYHSGSVLQHIARCMNEVAGDPLAVWIAMAHDAGKLTTPSALLPHHYGHELRGITLAAIWADALGLSEEYKNAGVFTAKWHMNAGRYADARPGKKHDILMASIESGIFSQFWKLVDADTKSRVSEQAADDLKKILAVPEADLSPDMLRPRRIDVLCKHTAKESYLASPLGITP